MLAIQVWHILLEASIEWLLCPVELALSGFAPFDRGSLIHNVALILQHLLKPNDTQLEPLHDGPQYKLKHHRSAPRLDQALKG